MTKKNAATTGASTVSADEASAVSAEKKCMELMEVGGEAEAEDTKAEDTGVGSDVLPDADPNLDAGSTRLLAVYFQEMFDLDFGLNFSQDSGLDDALGRRGFLQRKRTACRQARSQATAGEAYGQRFPSGPIAREQPHLAARRLNGSPLARLYYAVIMAEAMVFPLFPVRKAADKARVNAEIATIVGLDRAVMMELIDGFVICWETCRYPKRATQIRLLVPGGKRTRSRLLGEMETPLRQFVNAMKRGPDSL